MPIYIYKAKKGPTEIIDGEIDALSQDDAVEKLNILGLVAVSLAERQIRQEIIPEGAKQSQKEISSPVYGLRVTTATSIRIQDVGIFTLQLSSLIKAGVPVLRVLTLISQQTENKVLAKVTDELGKQIKDGKMLSEAMSQYPRIFNNLYVNMVKAGEKSGTLDGVLQNLAEYRQEEEDIRQKLQAALAYPVLIIIVGIITVFIMLTFFLPKLIGLFEGMRQTLPSSTMLLIKISRFMAGNWHWVLIFLFFLVAVFVRSKEGSKKKLLFDFFKLHLPFIKRFIRDAEIARFARTLALLLKNGISVCESLELATNVLDNDLLKAELKRAKDGVINQGCRLSESLKTIKVFPLFAVNMIAVGEEGGKLEQSLNTIADLYERQTDQAIKIITSLLEPLLILIIGAIVGFIVFAMLTPVFNIGVSAR
jgi:type II secretory pathway component PulF